VVFGPHVGARTQQFMFPIWDSRRQSMRNLFKKPQEHKPHLSNATLAGIGEHTKDGKARRQEQMLKDLVGAVLWPGAAAAALSVLACRCAGARRRKLAPPQPPLSPNRLPDDSCGACSAAMGWASPL